MNFSPADFFEAKARGVPDLKPTLVCWTGALGAGFAKAAAAHPLDEILGTQILALLPTSVEVFTVFTWLGFTHIVPKGLDHILFVLGLFLLNPGWRPLLWQVTAFTVAHSITLALAIQGIVSVPSEIVEPVIALSITIIALENVLSRELKPWRPVVVFTFGLIHGLGFAGVLEEVGLPDGDKWLALLAFNLGVELGQIAVIFLALGAVWFFRRSPWYRQRITIPASLLIGAVGLFWFLQRTVMSL